MKGKESIRFVSIDSSLANTGIATGIVTKDGVITICDIYLETTKKSTNKSVRASSDTVDRCRHTFDFVVDVINSVNPDVVFAETPSGSQSASGMKSYGSTCMLIASISPIPFEVTPQEVKKGSIGLATASKKEMIDWAYDLHPHIDWDLNKDGSLKNKNEHMADAIAIAYAAVQLPEFKRLLSF